MYKGTIKDLQLPERQSTIENILDLTFFFFLFSFSNFCLPHPTPHTLLLAQFQSKTKQMQLFML